MSDRRRDYGPAGCAKRSVELLACAVVGWIVRTYRAGETSGHRAYDRAYRRRP